MDMTVKFAAMDASHLIGALLMSQDAGWPHRIEDWAFVAGISNGVVALEGDQVVATALVTPFGEVAMANLIIVDSKLRGRGLGRKIMDHALERCSPSVWQLVATRDGLPLYESLGFKEAGEILQHQGIATSITPTGGAVWADADADAMAAIRLMDASATGMDRNTLYDALAGDARFAVLRNGAKITGFAAVRNFGRGEVVGPVAASTLEDAQRLISLILSEREGQFMRVDTNADSGLAPWLSEHGLVAAGGGVQMQMGTGAITPTGPQQIFALASQALG